jgi:hypothetical protein
MVAAEGSAVVAERVVAMAEVVTEAGGNRRQRSSLGTLAQDVQRQRGS